MRAMRLAMMVGFGLGIAGLAVAGVSPPSVDTPVSTGVRSPTSWGVVIYNSTDSLRGPLPSAKADGEAMAATLERTLGVPQLSNELFAPGVSSTNRLVVLGDRSAEQVREQLREVGKRAKAGEVVWVYVASHMTVASGRDGAAGLVVVPPGAPQAFGADDSSVLRESELWKLAGAGGAEVRVVLDGCATGRDAARVPAPSSGASGGMSYWRASMVGQAAHDLPGTTHGLATYFWLGGLRGWADGAPSTPGGEWGEADGKVTAAEQTRYVEQRVGEHAPYEQSVVYAFSGATQKDAVLAVGVHERDPFRDSNQGDRPGLRLPAPDFRPWMGAVYDVANDPPSATAGRWAWLPQAAEARTVRAGCKEDPKIWEAEGRMTDGLLDWTERWEVLQHRDRLVSESSSSDTRFVAFLPSITLDTGTVALADFDVKVFGIPDLLSSWSADHCEQTVRIGTSYEWAAFRGPLDYAATMARLVSSLVHLADLSANAGDTLITNYFGVSRLSDTPNVVALEHYWDEDGSVAEAIYHRLAQVQWNDWYERAPDGSDPSGTATFHGIPLDKDPQGATARSWSLINQPAGVVRVTDIALALLADSELLQRSPTGQAAIREVWAAASQVNADHEARYRRLAAGPWSEEDSGIEGFFARRWKAGGPKLLTVYRTQIARVALALRVPEAGGWACSARGELLAVPSSTDPDLGRIQANARDTWATLCR